MQIEYELHWWHERLIAHHGYADVAREAQIRHIGAEYGELLQEIQKFNGDNPRRPGRNSSHDKILDEMADVVITTLITMSLAYESFEDADNPVFCALNKVSDRFEYTVERMKQFDTEHEND